MKPNKAIRIDKAFEFDSVAINEESIIPTITIRGYASKMYDVNKKLVIDADSESVNTMGIDLSRLHSGNLPLLFGHDQKSAVGKITKADYQSDGLMIEATIFKLPNDALTNYVYEAVKAKIITSFSVGILVEEFDIVQQDGNDYLQLAKSLLIETSLVSVPSNAQATFQIQEIKDGAQKSFHTIISKSILKQENPNACEEFGQCVLATKQVGLEEKALTYDETKNSDWMKTREFHMYLESLLVTIEDNWYANKWDELSGEEVILNIKTAFSDFLKDQEKLLDIGVSNKSIDEHLKGQTVIIKDATLEEKVEAPATEETKVEIKPEDTLVPVAPTPTTVEETPKVENTPAEIPKVPERTLADLLVDVSSIKVSELEEAELEAVYESIMGVVESIEAMVVDQIKEELA